jgi:hypothetical protein
MNQIALLIERFVGNRFDLLPLTHQGITNQYFTKLRQQSLCGRASSGRGLLAAKAYGYVSSWETQKVL